MIKNMAPNNWITIAWDENGLLCPGRIEAEGTIIDICEHLLYVHDKKAWKEDSGFGRYTIMEISEGQLRYNRFKIVVARGINNAIFFAVEYNSDNTEDNKKQIFGFSCCIYDDDNRVAIVEDAKTEFFYWLEESKKDWWYNVNIDQEKIQIL